MYVITVKGTAKPNCSVKSIDVDSIWGDDSDFVEYIHNEELKSKLEEGAYLEFQKIGRSLYSIVQYQSKKKLNKKQLKELMEYTSSQWSDGIGEGFEQNPCGENNDGKELYISPWHYDQKIEVTQELID